jgi:AraC-like DNA-binding protein
LNPPWPAKRLLETSERAVDDICFDVGYEDPSFFRRLFRRRTGLAPAQYRRVFKPIQQAPAPRQPRASRVAQPERSGSVPRPRRDGRDRRT